MGITLYQPGGCGCGCPTFQVDTTWDGCVAPGTITVTIRGGSSSGPILTTATANASGIATLLYSSVSGYTLYYFSASTTTAGYSNRPITTTLPLVGNPPVGSPICPTNLTATGFWGSATLLPDLRDPHLGLADPPVCGETQGVYVYAATVNIAFAGGCGGACPTCAAATVPVGIVFSVSFNVNFSLCCPTPSTIGSPGFGCPTATGSGSVGPTKIISSNIYPTCYPVNYSSTLAITSACSQFAALSGLCAVGTLPFTVTQ